MRQNNEKEGKLERSSGLIEFCLSFLFWPFGANCMCVCAHLNWLSCWSLSHLTCTKGHMHLFSMLIWPHFLVDLLRHAINSWSQAFQTPGRWIIAHFVNLEHNIHVIYCADKMHNDLLLLWRACLDVKCSHALSSLTPIKAYTWQGKSISGPVTWVS